MAVKIGSARIDERGKAYGGSAGDQTGGEVGVQNWYLHKKGWRVFRAKDAGAAAKLAQAMRAACENPCIGYDQWQRDSLYKKAQAVGFDVSKVAERCETDCSALVRVCCAFAGIETGNFRTYNQPAALLATGAFVELKGSKYTGGSAYLGAGDILVTPAPGHTVIVLTGGAKYEGTVQEKEYAPGERILRSGDSGADVQQMQTYLIALGYDLGKWGADGDFGDCTELAVREFQRANGLIVDGEYGPKSHAALTKAVGEQADAGETVRIEGGQCWVRSEPEADGEKLGVAKRDGEYPFAGEVSDAGWLKIAFADGFGWVSGKYGRRVGHVG